MRADAMKTEATGNRAAMPVIAGIVDELRAMGQTVKVVYASEGGRTAGRLPKYENAFTVPANYHPSRIVPKLKIRQPQ